MIFLRHSWTSLEVEEAQEASLLVAADVIYSDDLTDAFFSTIERLMSMGSEKVRKFIKMVHNEICRYYVRIPESFMTFCFTILSLSMRLKRTFPCCTSDVNHLVYQVLYIALEKRYNFSLDDLDVVANGYSHFRSYLRDEEGKSFLV